MRLSAYQRRLRDIRFLNQYVEQLKDRCIEMAKQLGEADQPIRLMGAPIDGDAFLNDLADFDMRLACIADNARRKP